MYKYKERLPLLEWSETWLQYVSGEYSGVLLQRIVCSVVWAGASIDGAELVVQG